MNTYNLQFHHLPVHVDGPDLEVNPDGGDVALCVGVILCVREATGGQEQAAKVTLIKCFYSKGDFPYRKAQKQTWFSNSGITDQK